METVTSQTSTSEIVEAWNALKAYVPVSPIRTEEQYDQAVEKLHELLDVIGDDERHPLYELLDTLGILIRAYEETHYSSTEVKGKDMLHFLVEEHHLSPSQFPELGAEEVVAELLAGNRELSVENIRALSKRFGVSPATFI